MIELLVVVLTLGILATIAVGVFTTQVERSRYAAAKSTISALELAINRYQIDTGEFPESGSLSAPAGYLDGCGKMQLSLMHNPSATSVTLWRGPYITIKNDQLGDFNGIRLEELTTPPEQADVQILDPWHQPYRYVRSGPAPDDYALSGGTKLPTTHPFAATEVYYNPSTFQIVSKGTNGITLIPPDYGTDKDDITNFGM